LRQVYPVGVDTLDAGQPQPIENTVAKFMALWRLACFSLMRNFVR
jgi:hypothetical protein